MRNQIVSALVIGTLCAALPKSSSFACMAFPVPAACAVKLDLKMQEVLRDDMRQQKDQIAILRKRIKSEKQLLVAEVAALATSKPDMKTNLDLIANENLKAAALKGTPIAFAYRFEALRPKLTPEEWDEGVKLWEKYIARSEDLWEPKGYEEFCNLQAESQALKMAAGYIFAWPFLLSELNNGDIASTAAAGVIAGPLATAAGVIGIGGDVATFIPNVAGHAGGKLRRSIHLKLSSHAFQKFAELVKKYEKAHA